MFMIKGLVTILVCSVLIAVLGIPLILRKVPRNSVYGFRTRATLQDDYMWYEANAYFGKGLVVAGAITAVSIVILYFTPNILPMVFLKATIATLVAPLLLMVLFTVRFIHRLKSRRTEETETGEGGES